MAIDVVAGPTAAEPRAEAPPDVVWEIDLKAGAQGERSLTRVAYGQGAERQQSVESWLRQIHPLDRSRVHESLLAALDGVATVWREQYRWTADGDYLEVQDRGHIVRDSAGQALRVVGTMVDASARRRADEATTLYGAIVEASDDAIVTKGLDGTIRSWNAGAERLFGYTAREAVGQAIFLIVPPQRRAEEAEILTRLARGERVDHFETTRVTKDGRELDISLTVSPLRSPEGHIYGASKIARDISERTRAESRLRRQEAQRRLLWESAAALLSTERPDAMLHTVFDKIAPFVGADAYLSFKVDDTGDNLLPDSCRGIEDVELDSLVKAERSQIDTIARRHFVAGQLQDSSEPSYAWARRLGFLAAVGYPLVVDGRFIGALIFGARRKAAFTPDEVEFLEALCYYVAAAFERVALIRGLRETDLRKDEFLATLAHELRNPLAPIRNALEIMRVNSSAPSAVEEAARRMIERQLEQMVRLVDDLLDVSRITRGRLELRKEAVELSAVIHSAIETSRPLIDVARHELSVTLPRQPIHLDADPTRLAQVFSNLLNNAVRYMDKGGRIWLEAAAHGNVATVSVRDAGIGIAAEALPRIFDMFAQVDESAGRSPTGLGIGLTLVKRLVELHGGTIDAHSAGLGQGATFTVRLPVTPLRAAVERPRAEQPLTHFSEHSMTHRILVADDNKDAAESMGMLLRLMGNEVRTVYDGEKAVEEAEAFRPDMVVLDIGMPKLSGYEVARRIREQPWSSGTVLVALTGWGQEDDKRKAAEAGFDRHFTKPIDPAELQRLVTERRE